MSKSVDSKKEESIEVTGTVTSSSSKQLKMLILNEKQTSIVKSKNLKKKPVVKFKDENKADLSPVVVTAPQKPKHIEVQQQPQNDIQRSKTSIINQPKDALTPILSEKADKKNIKYTLSTISNKSFDSSSSDSDNLD